MLLVVTLVSIITLVLIVTIYTVTADIFFVQVLTHEKIDIFSILFKSAIYSKGSAILYVNKIFRKTKKGKKKVD